MEVVIWKHNRPKMLLAELGKEKKKKVSQRVRAAEGGGGNMHHDK